jgi:YHS domain-containing protein
MSRALLPALAIAAAFLIVTPAEAQQGHGQVQSGNVSASEVLCPVTNEPIDRGCVARFRGKWVYFANDEAKARFEGDPYEYSEGVKAQWDADKPLRVQVKCPVTGKTPASDVYTGAGLTAVFFADQPALKKWASYDAEAKMKALKGCFVYQTGCATCGMPINIRVKREIDGQPLYFCCEGCVAAFAKDNPERLREIQRTIRSNQAAWKRVTKDFVAEKGQQQRDAKKNGKSGSGNTKK